jgi:hypothetical protein
VDRYGSSTINVPGRKDRKLSLDHRALASFEEELDMRSGITGRRAPHEWPACWLRATFPVVLGLGGLAGCALLTEVAPPELGQSLDGVRQEVAQLRVEMAQLGALFRVVEDGVWARDAALVQLDAALAQLGKRLQVLEKAERLSAVEHRLRTLEGAPPELSRPPAPAGSGRGRPSGHWLQVGMSPDAIRARLGAPVSVEETPDFVFGHYGPEQSVVFRRDTERVQGWLGFTAAHLENTLR